MNSEVQQGHFSSPSHGAVRGRYCHTPEIN
jgi:hypothetical protein